MTQLKGFKFVTTLVLVFKKIEGKDKTKYENFYKFSTSYVNVKIQVKQNQVVTTNPFIYCNFLSAAAPIFK